MTATDTILDLAKTTDNDLVRSPEWYRQLVEAVNDLADKDFGALIQVLYRLDVDEGKIKRALAANPGQDAAGLIAGLLLERQLQKLESRKHFASFTSRPEEPEW
jgi:hypothetical protein